MLHGPLPILITALCGVLASGSARAMPAAPELDAAPTTIRLWAGPAPGALGDRPVDIPTLTLFRPAAGTANGASMLILPGGGYAYLNPKTGETYAQWLVRYGITAYVLKYRLGKDGYRHPTELNDASRALRMVRAFARRDGLDPARVGIIGSSAGGHLAATLITHWAPGDPTAADPVERESSRPDLAVLCYPVITMGEYTHAGSRRELLGDHPMPEQIHDLSAELNVTATTPPTFLWHTDEDKTAPVENSLHFAEALRRAGVPFSLHIYEKGPHGLGLGQPRRPAPPWAADCLSWFRSRGFIR